MQLTVSAYGMITNAWLQAHPYYYLVRLARIGISGTDIDAPPVRAFKMNNITCQSLIYHLHHQSHLPPILRHVPTMRQSGRLFFGQGVAPR